MKVYICGNLGGDVISDATRQRFAMAEEMLKAKGYEVENPASEDYQLAMSSVIESYELASVALGQSFNKTAEIMMYNFDKIKNCEVVYILSIWGASSRAVLEYTFAEFIGVDFLCQDLTDAKFFLERKFMRELIKEKSVSSDHLLQWYNLGKSEYAKDHLNEVWLPIE